MKPYAIGSALLFVVATALVISREARSTSTREVRSSSLRNHCVVVHGWPTLPDGEILGQVTGVGVDSRGDVWVFHRAGRIWTTPFPSEPITAPTVWGFDARTGSVVQRWGSGLFIMPHGLTIDRADNVWVTDVGTHQVYKFSKDGRLLLTRGERGVPGADTAHFNLPSDVAVRRDGGFYVSDGYGNTRVVQYGPAGEYVREWGRAGTGFGEFDLPHGIAIDDAGRVYVADRTNARVQVFDSAGSFVTHWSGPDIGRPYAVAIAPNSDVFTVDGGDQPEFTPDRSGATWLTSGGEVITRFGRFGNYDGQFRLAHDIAVGPNGAVYVGDARGQRVQKFLCNK